MIALFKPLARMIAWPMKISFTNHAEGRMNTRGLLKQEALDAIRCPDNTIKKYGKYYFQKKLDRGTIEVCCEKTENNINVITVYWV
jgi:hypothetical protein